MFKLIAILCTLFWTFSSDDINVSYSQELDAIVINGLDSIEFGISDLDVSVYFGNVPKNTTIPNVIGNLKSVGSQFFFKSKYGFSNGASYTVIITPKKYLESKTKRQSRFVITIPKANRKPSTYINAVFPSIAKLPMNQLKLYIEFSGPMKTGNAFDYIRLYKMPEGKFLEDAFLIMPDELWDTQKKRLTILFDPGRIKRGIQPNLQLGLPLVEGHSYKLIIDENWLDINGNRIIKGYEKSFEVIAVDRTAPNKDNWAILLPERGSRKPIVIDFKEPMDYGLMQSALMIVDRNNQPVKGRVSLFNHESTWSFTPDSPWVEGDYKIVINAWLEDLAGNSLRRKFDVNLNNKLDNPKDIEKITIPSKIN